MTETTNRSAAIEQTISSIRAELDDTSDTDALNRAAAHLAALASRTELFPRSDFPLPLDGRNDITTRLRQDADGGFALYVNSGLPANSFRPHDHGVNWAIIAGVEGHEIHRVYDRVDDCSNDEAAKLERREDIELKPGGSVALPGGTIHSVHGQGEEPILHLHLYQMGFHVQTGRTEYDLDAGRAFYIANLGQFDSDIVDFG